MLSAGRSASNAGSTKRHLTATPLTVYGVQGLPTPCVPPLGATVVERDTEAVITEVSTGGGFVNENWYGCLRDVGRQWLLGSGGRNSEGYDLPAAPVLAGPFVALDFTSNEHALCGGSITVTDLRTGEQSVDFDEPCASDMIDALVLNANGFAAWHVTDSSQVPSSAFGDVACPTTSLCVAVDASGNVVTSTNPTGGPSAWTMTAVAPGVNLTGVSCPNLELCVAVGGTNVLTSSDPTGGTGSWTASEVPSANLNDVTCPSPSLCVAVGQDSIATSTDPTAGAGAWSTASLPAHDLFGVSCPSVSLCVAVDDSGSVLTSTDPTGGAGTWSVADVEPDEFLGGVACPSTTLCVVDDFDRGQILTSTNPTGGASAWTQQDVANVGLNHASCPTESFCVLAGLGGIAASSDPTGGAGAWTTAQPIGADGLTGISCPSTSLCVAVTNGGQVTTSTNPTGGSTDWTTNTVDIPSCGRCLAERIYAHDDQGTRVVDSAPPGSGTSLANLDLVGNLLTWTHNGMPDQTNLG